MYIVRERMIKTIPDLIEIRKPYQDERLRTYPVGEYTSILEGRFEP